MNNGFPPFNQPWIIPAALILLIVVIVVLLALAIEENRHPHLRRHGRHQVTEARGEAEADTFIGELRKSGPWENAARPASPAPTMVPEPPLTPLPELTDEEAADFKERFAAAMKEGRPPVILPPDLDDRPATVSEACWYGPCTDCTAWPDCDCGHHREGTVTIRPAQRTQTTGEIFEHLCEGTACWCHSFKRVPQEVFDGLGHHATVDESLNSIVVRSEREAKRFRAELEARLAADDTARANGQVRHG